MWRYKLPGFAPRLLYELQKQQQCSVHCDILLQTQGVSIPAHSCVLSALSPVFCRAFSNASSLPIGQSRLVQLEAVGAHALMKLVGFMYSGEMEGESLDEQQEVIEIAYRLGFSNFMDGKKKQVNRHQNKTASWREIGLQTEETGERKNDASIQILSKKQTITHSSTQTESSEAHIADTCVASVPKLPIGLTAELTEVPSEFNSISPDAGLAWIDEFADQSPLNSDETLVKVNTKSQQNQKAKKRAKTFKKGDTQISLKIKLKRQSSGALWETVSVQKESTAEGSKTCGSSDDPPMTHSLAETHKRSGEVQLSLSPSLAFQNLATVTLTPPSELTTSLPATPTRTSSEHYCHNALLPVLSQQEESNKHASKLLEMVTVGLNILPSVTVEGNSSTHEHLDQNLEKCAALSKSSDSYICLLEHNLGIVAFETSSTSEQRETGSEDQSNCRKWNLKNVSSVASDQTSFSWTSPCITQKKNTDSSFTPPCPMTDILPSKPTFGIEDLGHQDIVELKTVLNNSFWGADNSAQSEKQIVSDTNENCTAQTHISGNDISNAAEDQPASQDKQCPEMLYVTDQASKAIDSDNWEEFCEMRLPRCLSPLAPEEGKTTGIFTQVPFQPLEFSSCLSASHGNLQPAIRYTSTPIEPQALPGKTNPQYPLCTSPHLDELNCLVVGKNSCPLKSNRGHNGVATYSASEEKMTKMTDFENDPKHALDPVNEPYRKKAKMACYPDGVNTQTVKVLNPCSVKIKNLRHIANIQDISNSVSPEKIDCLKSAKTKNTVSKDLKSQEKLPVCKKSQPIKCKDQEACRKKVQDITQPALLVTKCGHGRPLQKRKCTKDLMKDLSTLSVMNSSSAVAPSSSWHDDVQLPQMSVACAPSQGRERVSKVHRPPVGLAPTITTVNDLISKCELNKVAEPELKNPFVEPEKVIPDVNLNREDEKQCKTHTLCDQIFHQTIFSVFPTITEHFPPVYHQPISILQTNAETNKTSLTSKKLREPSEPAEINPNLMNKNRQENKGKTEEREIEKGVPGPDKPGEALDTDKKVDSTNRVEIEHVDGSSINVNGCLVNGKVARESEISANTSLSFHDLNAASHFCTVPSARDVNNFHFQLENNLQLESNTLFHPFRSENVTEEAKTNEQITECNDLQKVPIFIQTTEVNLIKTKGLHLEETRIIKIGKDLEKEKEKESTYHVDISGMNENEAGIRDIEVEVLDESAQIAAGHGYEVVTDEGNIDDDDVEESENSVDMDNDGEALAREEEFNGQHEEVVDTDAPSNQRGEEPDLSSSPVVILLDVNTESADDCSSAEEELVVDDISDSPVQSSPLVITPILKEEDVLKEVVVVVKRKKEEEEEEEEEVDVTGEESN